MDLDEPVDHWTLLKDERELVAGKRGPTRLGFALVLKFCARAGRFPHGRPSWMTTRSRSSPARSACQHPTSGSTNGQAARSRILARYTQAAGITASISPNTLRHFLFTWLKTQGIDDALIQPYSGRHPPVPGDLLPPRPGRFSCCPRTPAADHAVPIPPIASALSRRAFDGR